MEKEFVDGLVSVITPVYNAEKYIGEMIDSVLLQTYKNIELVLVDDCSKDNSFDVIKKYNDDRIIYHKQEKNMGAGVARNTALEIARGQYVAFLDADDIWENNKIEKQIELMKNTNSWFSYTGASIISDDGEFTKKIRKVKFKCSYKKLLKNTMIITSSVLIDRNHCGDFRMSEIRSGQDYATWLMLLRKKGVAYGVREPLCRYRIANNSLSSNKFKSIKQVYNIQRKQEKINPISALFNTFCFILNALKKHLF